MMFLDVTVRKNAADAVRVGMCAHPAWPVNITERPVISHGKDYNGPTLSAQKVFPWF